MWVPARAGNPGNEAAHLAARTATNREVGLPDRVDRHEAGKDNVSTVTQFGRLSLLQGWDDVSFHGSSQIPTPNIDALAADGVVLNNYYVQPFCTPSRAALMTGLYPIRTGMQGLPISVAEPWGLPLNVRIMPQYFKELGYETHLIGKWHLGSYTRNHTPTSRGFDSFYGFYNGEEDYFTHSVTCQNQTGLDFWHNTDPLWTSNGTYSTTLFTQRAKDVIRNRKKGKSLFLVLSYQAVHGTGSSPPLQAPPENIEKFPYIGETSRTIFAGMVDAMDLSVGEVFQALSEAGVLDNTVIVFSSDNGGAPFGMHSSRSFNWPLRGTKGTLWEGGTRAAAFLWSSLLARRQRVSNLLMHITDWLPTLYSLAGGNVANLPQLDGQNMWQHLSNGWRSPRAEVLYNTEPSLSAAAIRNSKYKLVVDSTGLFNQRYLTAGGSRPRRDLDDLLFKSDVGKALRYMYGMDGGFRLPKGWRRRATLDCREWYGENFSSSDSVYLFDIVKDPCELNNLARVHPDIVAKLQQRLNAYQAAAMPAVHKPGDPAALPDRHNGTWAPWVL
ncbi:arylsulfatase B-like [Dermacentor andersoni]|uniref:arylsulfatase B-like n=1 Tax=Dermacentor andersoni TaxID=34620 RepID=UPI002415B811|nr:arylsulfatase B-like [Dermacentor andersoni]